MGVLEIFGGCPGDIWWVSWGYSVGILKIFEGVLEIFDWYPRDIWSVS